MIGGKLCWDKGAWQNRSEKKMQRQQKVCYCRIFFGGVQGWVVFFEGGNKKLGNAVFVGNIFGEMSFSIPVLFESDGVFLVIGCFLLSFSKEGIEVVYTPPQKLTQPLKMDGWGPILSFWDGLFSGANC